jgi:hypothetical protein
LLQEQNRWRLDGAYVREFGPTIEIVEPASFSARPSGLSRPVRMILGAVIGLFLTTTFLIGYAIISRRKDSDIQSNQPEDVRVKVLSKR